MEEAEEGYSELKKVGIGVTRDIIVFQENQSPAANPQNGSRVFLALNILHRSFDQQMLAGTRPSFWLNVVSDPARSRHLINPAMHHRSVFTVSRVRIGTALNLSTHSLSAPLTLRASGIFRTKSVLTSSRPVLTRLGTHAQQYTSKAAPQEDDTSAQAAAAQLVAPGTWLDRMPKSIQPYLYLTRIDKPIGTWLLFWPCGMYRGLEFRELTDKSISNCFRDLIRD